MTGLGALLKKEFREQLRTHKLLIISAAFLLFGFGTPLLFKYMPQLLEMAGEDIVIQMPEPTAAMAIGEYTGTLVQFGILITVLIAMGAIARERERGVAAMILSKPVGRGAYVTAKLVAMAASFAIALGLGSVACYAYTALLIEPADVSAFLGLNLLLVLFFVVCLAITLLLSSLFRNYLVAGGIALATLIGQALTTRVPLIRDYTPGRLPDWGIALLSGPTQSAWGAVAVSLVIIVICLFLSRLALRRKGL